MVEEVDLIHSASPVDDKIGIDLALDCTPFSVETGTDRAFVPMEISSGRDDTDSKEDSLGPSNILKQSRLDKARKYEEDRRAKEFKKGYYSQLPHELERIGNVKTEEEAIQTQLPHKLERIGNVKMEEEAVQRMIVYSSDIKGLTQDLYHVSIKCLTHIRKIIQEALFYLNALDLIKPAFALMSGTAYFSDALDKV